MPQIEAKKGVITQINVFTVAHENQQRLIDVLIEATHATHAASAAPGWMSASLHRSLDGTKVVNYAQCESYEAWEAVMEKLKEGHFLQKNKEFGGASPGLYEVVYTVER